MSIKIVRNSKHDQHVTYDTRTEIGNTQIEMFTFPLSGADREFIELARKHGLPVAIMLSNLASIPGIERVFVSPYSVSVHMHKLFFVNDQIDKVVENGIVMADILGTLKKLTSLVIRSFPNRYIREFATTVEICESGRGDFSRPLSESNPKSLERIGKKGRSIVETLMKTPGVIEVSIKPYHVSVMIAPAFEWENIEPLVIEAIAKQVGNLRISRG